MLTEDAVDAFYVELGARIRALRQEANGTQASLGAATGLTRSSIANLEAGRQRIPAHTLAAIAASLDKTLDELVPEPGAKEDSIKGRDGQREDLERYSDTALGFVRDGLSNSSAARSSS